MSVLPRDLNPKDSINNSNQSSLIHSEPLILSRDGVTDDRSYPLISIP